MSDAVAGSDLPHGAQLLLGGLQGGLQPGDLTAPPLAAGFGDAGLEVVADLQQPGLLAGIRAKLRASDATVLVRTWGAKVPCADPQSDLSELEVVEELVPFFGGEVAVFLAGPESAPAGDEGPVMGNDVFGVDRYWRRRILELSECLLLIIIALAAAVPFADA